MHIERHEIALTTNSGGAATGYSPVITGRVLALHYVKPGSGGFADGVDFTITAEKFAEPILAKNNVDATASFRPRVPVQDEAGADATLDGTVKMRDAVALANDRVKVVIANGGDTKVGSVWVVVG